MPDQTWKDKIDKEIKVCYATRATLNEKTKQQQKEIDEGRKERLELYDHKNAANDRLTAMEGGKVDYKTFTALSKCVTTLKTEKKFLPYIAMIVSTLAALGTLIYVIVKLGGN